MKKVLIIIGFLLISNCGFKVINLSNENFSVVQINTTGDKRINYLIKNNFLINSDSNKKQVIINLNSNKNKSIKEKNIKMKLQNTRLQLLQQLLLKI